MTKEDLYSLLRDLQQREVKSEEAFATFSSYFEEKEGIDKATRDRIWCAADQIALALNARNKGELVLLSKLGHLLSS